MSKIKTIFQQAERKYSDFLCAYIQDELDKFFPLIIGQFAERFTINDNRELQKQKLENLVNNSKQKLASGYETEWKTKINTRTTTAIASVRTQKANVPRPAMATSSPVSSVSI